MKLNWDVLIYLFPYLTSQKRHVYHLMVTCRILFEAGVSHLYGGDIWIRYNFPRRTLYRLRYALASRPRYASFIRKLSVAGAPRDYTPESIALVPQILCLCHAVEDLFIDDAEAFMEYPGFKDALLSLRNVEKIKLELVGPSTKEALTESPWRITSAVVGPSSDAPEERVDVLPPLRPISFLEPFSKHLAEVSVICPHELDTPVDVQYPKVLTLRLVGLSEREFDLDALQAAFPNIQTFDWVNDSVIGPRTAKRRRGEQISRESAIASHYSWPSLNFLRCTPSRAYSLALTCPVRVWDCRHQDHFYPVRFHSSHFRATVRDIDPTHVMLSIVVEDSFLNHSSNIFPPSNISHVRVSLDLGSCTDDLSDILVREFFCACMTRVI